MGPDNNGHDAAGAWYIPFGDAPGNELSPVQTEAVLRLLWDRHRPLLAACIGEALTGARPQATRAKG